MIYIFDFFGVISSEIAPFWFAKYLPDYDISELRKKYVVDADLGNTQLSVFYKKLAELTDQKEDVIAQQWFSLAQIDERVVYIIKELKGSHQLALCSNAPTNLIRPILQQHDLEKVFDVIVISGEVGMVKPNEDIYIYTLELLKTTASETVFIDDSETNVSAASKLGMNAILYRDIKDVQNLLDV